MQNYLYHVCLLFMHPTNNAHVTVFLSRTWHPFLPSHLQHEKRFDETPFCQRIKKSNCNKTMGYGPLNHWTTSKSRLSNVFLGCFRTFFVFVECSKLEPKNCWNNILAARKISFGQFFPWLLGVILQKSQAGGFRTSSNCTLDFEKKRQMQESTYCSMWWQLKHFYFHPWGNDPIWRAYFSTGLKPPTSHECVFFWHKNGHYLYNLPETNSKSPWKWMVETTN